jgi:hypothetical protein
VPHDDDSTPHPHTGSTSGSEPPASAAHIALLSPPDRILERLLALTRLSRSSGRCRRIADAYLPSLPLPGWLLTAALLVAVAAAPQADPTAAPDTWVDVDTRTLTLTVMRGKEVLRRFENIAIGSNGTTRDKLALDEKTPLGEFRIDDIRTSDRFHLFLSITYPTPAIARRAWVQGTLDARAYADIRRAWSEHVTPPQDTALGGHLGIHGLGAGDPAIHERFNWTNGCIALTNEQVSELAALVQPGVRVIVH